MKDKIERLAGKSVFHFAVLCLLPVLIYSNSLKNEFHYDDMFAIVNNQAIRSAHNIPALFLEVIKSSGEEEVDSGYRPFLALSFMASYFISGMNPAGFRLFNLLFHIFNTMLVYLLARGILTGKCLPGSPQKNVLPLIAGLLFACHPVHSEAVNYIHARSSVLSTFFILVSVYSYAVFRGGPAAPQLRRAALYALSLACFISGVLTKEEAFILPLLLCLVEYCFISGADLKKSIAGFLKYILPFFILLSVYVFHRVFMVSNLESPGGMETITAYVLTQSRVIVRYILLMFYPVNLAVERYVPMSAGIFDSRVVFSGLLILLVLYAAVMLFGRKKEISFSIFWFFIALIPTSIIPLIIIMNEHRLYLAGAGAALAGAAVTGEFYAVLEKKHNKGISLKITAVIVVLIISFFCLRDVKRNLDWRNGYTLWSKNIKVSPGSFRAHNNLGSFFDKKNDYDKAAAEYEESLRLNPGSATTHNNAGIIYYRRGLYDKAIEHYLAASALENGYTDAINNLGIVYAEKRMYNEALEQFERVVELAPLHKDVYKNMGLLYRMKADAAGAAACWEKYLEINPQAPDAAIIRAELDKMRNEKK